jgi:S1-C subfamily serine protease
MPDVLQAFPYPWSDPVAQELLTALTQLFPSVPAAVRVAEQAGIQVWTINTQQSAEFVWKEILESAASQGITRVLVQRAGDLVNVASPRRPFLDDLLHGREPVMELRTGSGAPPFISRDDQVSQPEALLYRDDLTLPIGRVPALARTLETLAGLAPAVCRLEVDVNGSASVGTGFRIGTDLILTNWHVLFQTPDGQRATRVTAEFGYDDDGSGGVLTATAVAGDVASIIADKTYDWAVIRVPVGGTDWPALQVADLGEPAVGDPAYIIQHPSGSRKRIAFVRNQISFVDERVVHYLTDTQAGSSGSPVLDAAGRLIGVHHLGGRSQEVLGSAPLKKNEGIRMSRILAGLRAAGVTI